MLTCKIWFRYSRERVHQKIAKICKKNCKILLSSGRNSPLHAQGADLVARRLVARGGARRAEVRELREGRVPGVREEEDVEGLHLGDLYTESGQTLLHSVLQLWFYWYLRIFLNNMSKCLYKYCQMFAKFHRNVAQFTEPRFPKFQGNSSGILCMKSEEKQVEKQVRYRKIENCRNLPHFVYETMNAQFCRNSKARR